VEVLVALFVCGAAGIGWSVTIALRLWRELAVWRHIRRVGPTPVAALRPGTVVVRGRARRIPTLPANCLAWEDPAAHSSGCVPFLVEDESGAVRVEAGSVRLAGAHRSGTCRMLLDGDELSLLGVAEASLDPAARTGYREPPTTLVVRARELLVSRPTRAVLARSGVVAFQVAALSLVSLLAVGASVLCLWFLVGR
jgi:hypothetical protein